MRRMVGSGPDSTDRTVPQRQGPPEGGPYV